MEYWEWIYVLPKDRISDQKSIGLRLRIVVSLQASKPGYRGGLGNKLLSHLQHSEQHAWLLQMWFSGPLCTSTWHNPSTKSDGLAVRIWSWIESKINTPSQLDSNCNETWEGTNKDVWLQRSALQALRFDLQSHLDDWEGVPCSNLYSQRGKQVSTLPASSKH